MVYLRDLRVLRLFLQKLRLDPDAYLQLRLARLHVRRVLPRQGFLREFILYKFNRFFIQNNKKKQYKTLMV
jgi:hypothetical protein